MPSDKTKYNKIITKNTFYFNNPEFETRYESELHSMRETLLYLRNQVKQEGLKKRFLFVFFRRKIKD